MYLTKQNFRSMQSAQILAQKLNQSTATHMYLASVSLGSRRLLLTNPFGLHNRCQLVRA